VAEQPSGAEVPAPPPVTGRSRCVEFTLVAAAAIAVPLAWWLLGTLWRGANSYNDFHDYWLAAKLITLGQSPYDVAALKAIATTEHLQFLVGGGYQYPLPFAVAMIPFTALPFGTAVLVFNSISLALFGLTASGWIGWAHGWGPALRWRRLALAAAAGLYPPIYGTIANGQANLILFPLIGLGVVLALDGNSVVRRSGGGILVGLAAIVKLVPGVLAVPLAIGRRIDAAAGIAAGALGTLLVADLLAPQGASGGSGLASLFDADPYFTNQSFNGFMSRIVRDSDRTVALWKGGFDPKLPMLVLTVAFGLATFAVLWWNRGRLASRRGLVLGLGFALVAGVIGAPKNSFWNQASALFAVGLLLAVDVPDLRLSRLGRLDLILLAGWLAGSAVFALYWTFSPAKTVVLAPVVSLLESSSLYGLLALWWLLARRLRLQEPGTGLSRLGQTAGTQTS
jgi:hypothetical protein